MSWQRYKPVLSGCQAVVEPVMGPGSTLLCQCNMSDTRGQHQAADRHQPAPVMCLRAAAGSSHPSCTLASFFFFPPSLYLRHIYEERRRDQTQRGEYSAFSAKRKKKNKVPPSSLKITAGSSNRKLVRFTSLQLTDASVDTRSGSSLPENPRQPAPQHVRRVPASLRESFWEN